MVFRKKIQVWKRIYGITNQFNSFKWLSASNNDYNIFTACRYVRVFILLVSLKLQYSTRVWGPLKIPFSLINPLLGCSSTKTLERLEAVCKHVHYSETPMCAWICNALNGARSWYPAVPRRFTQQYLWSELQFSSSLPSDYYCYYYRNDMYYMEKKKNLFSCK